MPTLGVSKCLTRTGSPCSIRLRYCAPSRGPRSRPSARFSRTCRSATSPSKKPTTASEKRSNEHWREPRPQGKKATSAALQAQPAKTQRLALNHAPLSWVRTAPSSAPPKHGRIVPGQAAALPKNASSAASLPRTLARRSTNSLPFDLPRCPQDCRRFQRGRRVCILLERRPV